MTSAASSLLALRRELRPTLRLALPLVAAELGWMSMGIVDAIMVGRLPDSATALGAVSLGQNLYYMVSIFGAGIFLGLDTLVSQAFGRRDTHDANSWLLHSMVLVLILTPGLMAFAWLWPPVMHMFGVKAELIATMDPFVKALNWGTLPLLAYFALRRYLQSAHIVAPVTFALISANIVNAVGNWVLIYGHLGSPALGVAGSGWSTCISRCYMAAVLAVAVIANDHRKNLQLWQTHYRLEFQRFRRLLALGLPAAGQILVEIAIFALASTLIGTLGAVPLAAHQIALNSASFAYMVPLGISSAAAVRVGNAIGAGDRPRARQSGWMSILLGAGFMACAALIFVSFPTSIARIFSPDPAVIATARLLLFTCAAFALFDGIQTVATGALRGAGDTRTPLLAHLACYWLIGLPLGVLLCFHFRWGAVGLWIGLCLALICIGSTLLYAWIRISRPGAHIDPIENTAAAQS